MMIKDWFLEKNFTQNERYAISTCNDIETKKETEKAMLFTFHTEFGTITKWIPKSVIVKNVVDVIAPKNKMNIVDILMKNKAGETIHIIKENGIIGYADNGKRYAMKLLEKIA